MNIIYKNLSEPGPLKLYVNDLSNRNKVFSIKTSLMMKPLYTAFANMYEYKFGVLPLKWDKLSGQSVKKLNYIQMKSIPSIVCLGLFLFCGYSLHAQRSENNIIVKYGFTESSGNIVHDISGVGAPLDLTIMETTSKSWIQRQGVKLFSDHISIASVYEKSNVPSINSGTANISVTHNDEHFIANNSVSVTQSSPSETWISQDIGSVAAAGSTTIGNGEMTIKGSGVDIWYAADGFHYYYRTLSGDIDAIIKVKSIQLVTNDSKVGIMIRDGSAVGAKHASTFIYPTQGIGFERRINTNGNTEWSNVSGIGTPLWLRMVKIGNNFTSYYSSNGTTWIKVGQTLTLSMSNPLVGIAITSQKNGTLAEAVITESNLFDFGTIVQSISLSPEQLNLYVGNAAQLQTQILPSNAANKTVTWASSNASIAMVNESGLVTALAPGTANISATTNDGNFVAQCAVSVTQPAQTSRNDQGVIVKYNFVQGTENKVRDVSGVGTPLDLTIMHPNNVSWIPGQGLKVNAATTIHSTTSTGKIVSACKATNEITIEAWIKPVKATLTGPRKDHIVIKQYWGKEFHYWARCP
jgi:hypothetical protein